MDEKKTTVYKPVLLSQANLLTQARYEFNLVEKRCLYQIIREVRRTHVENATGEKDLWGNMRVTVSFDMLEECTDADHLKYACDSLKRLRKRDLEINDEERWVNLGFINFVEYRKRERVFEVEVSHLIMPYLVELARNFTTYDLTVAITLKSTYSQRFYEFCSQYRHRANRTFFFTVNQMRDMLMLGDKYANSADLKRCVIAVAEKELKKGFEEGQCDLWFDYRVHSRQGKKVLSWSFTVHTREDERIDAQTAADCVRRIRSVLASFFPRDKKFAGRVLAFVQLHPDMAEEVAAKMQKKVFDYPERDVPPILRYVLAEDFHIK
jgi:plasmid replication initiation protein